jgi:hypothetical protein
VKSALLELGRKQIRWGKDLTPEEQAAIVRGRLLENVIIGTDRGVMSAKQLGADRRVSMWQPESQSGLVILQAPVVRKIGHAVPLLPPIEDEDDSG